MWNLRRDVDSPATGAIERCYIFNKMCNEILRDLEFTDPVYASMNRKSRISPQSPRDSFFSPPRKK